MPSSVEARKTGKRSIGKAKKVKNVGLKRTKGVCAHNSSKILAHSHDSRKTIAIRMPLSAQVEEVCFASSTSQQQQYIYHQISGW